MSNNKEVDVILIGAGIMSATLGALLKELVPEWNIRVFEKLSRAGEESSNEWNNAGTGHSALCELNYTPEELDGSIDVSKALEINEQFQLSRQFWSYLIKEKRIADPARFVMSIPHMSFVQGERDVAALQTRFEQLSQSPLFEGMEFSDDLEQLEEWMPLVMKGRQADERIAATRIDCGTDVNFGELTRMLMKYLQAEQVAVDYEHTVKQIKRTYDNMWEVHVRDEVNNETKTYRTRFVFIGAGGGSLPLLQKTGIPESKRVGGFPVSGLFMVCNNREVIAEHHAKVYGKAKLGAPPMSVPHLDTRYINGEKALLFGPFAGFSPKFLKTGSNMDLIGSIKPNNLLTMLAAGFKEMSLTKYLVGQVMLSHEKRLETLREFVPNAKSEDWEIVQAGQRVQVIKDTAEEGRGTLQFGTEVVSSTDGSIAALLGASPGASTAVHIMLEVFEKCFPQHMDAWEPKLKEMLPSYGGALNEDADLLREIRTSTAEILGLCE